MEWLQACTRAALRIETTRAPVWCTDVLFFSDRDLARYCPSRRVHSNMFAHTPPAHGASGRKRSAGLAQDEMLTWKKQNLDRTVKANLTDHRITLRSGCWLTFTRHACSFLGRLLGLGFFARGLGITSAHVFLEVGKVSAGVGQLTRPYGVIWMIAIDLTIECVAMLTNDEHPSICPL